MKVTAIWAEDLKGAIGVGNELPWHIKEDLQHFKKITENKPVVVGSNTWLSLPKLKLPGRTLFVVCDKDFASKYVDAVDSNEVKFVILSGDESIADVLPKVKLLVNDETIEEVVVAGGASVYRQFLENDLVDTVWRTKVYVEVPNADAYAPIIPSNLKPTIHGTSFKTESGLTVEFQKFNKN